jgi:predicted branched-subunit amino acid permease
METTSAATPLAVEPAADRERRYAPVIGDAVRDIAPVVVSVAPFAVLLGVTMAELGLSASTGLAGSALIYGGSAQLAALSLLGVGATSATVVAAAAVVNARLLLYSAVLEPRFRGQPRWFRWLAPHFIVDQTFALASGRVDLADPKRFRGYWLTSGLVLGAGWLAAIGAGLGIGPALPAATPLDLAPTALLVGLLVPKLTSRPAVLAAVVAAATAALAGPLPHNLGLLVGAIAGLAGAAAADRRNP